MAAKAFGGHPISGVVAVDRSVFAGFSHLFDVGSLRLGGQPLADAGHLTFSWHVLSSSRAICPGSTAPTDCHAPVRLRRMVLVELTSRRCVEFWKHEPPIDRSTGSGAAAIWGEAEGHPTGAAPILTLRLNPAARRPA